MTDEYSEAVEQAKKNLEDIRERGEDALGEDWEEFKKEIFTPAEIAEMNLKAMIISELITARRERGISQTQLGELSGLKKSAIAKLENGNSNPTVETIQKLLFPLGKKLAVVSM